jgi:hypothetical protein
MAHKLAELKTIYRIEFSANPPTLTKEGDIDTSGMAENGNLASGNHKPSGGNNIPITGRAFKHQGRTFFTFSHEGGAPGAFIGELTFDKNNKLIVTGTFSVNTPQELEEAVRLKLLPANQQEEPWIITKP